MRRISVLVNIKRKRLMWGRLCKVEKWIVVFWLTNRGHLVLSSFFSPFAERCIIPAEGEKTSYFYFIFLFCFWFLFCFVFLFFLLDLNHIARNLTYHYFYISKMNVQYQSPERIITVFFFNKQNQSFCFKFVMCLFFSSKIKSNEGWQTWILKGGKNKLWSPWIFF